MGEETEIAEPMTSEDFVAAEVVKADEPPKDHSRKRKKHLYKSLRELLEFYMGDVNLSKDRFMSQRLQGKPFVYVDLSIFLSFNKVKALTSSVEDLANALSHSEILQVSEDGTQVCRKTPISKKENEDDCTIYVEQLRPNMNHDKIIKMFSEFGQVDYVSLPRFSNTGKFKGFAFVEFRDPECVARALEAFNARGCCLSPHMAPEELMSIRQFDKENKKEEDKAEEEDSEAQHKEHAEEDNNETCAAEKTDDGSENQHELKHVKNKNGEGPSKKMNYWKEKKKRKLSEENAQVEHKKVKKQEVEDDQFESDREVKNKKRYSGKSRKSTDEGVANEVPEDDKKPCDIESKTDGKKKSKKRHSSSKDEQISGNQVKDKEEREVFKESHGKKKNKRKHSAEEVIADTSNPDVKEEETSEPAQKKLKSDNEDAPEAEVSHTEAELEEDETGEQSKKKRKRKKKKDKITAFSLGLKVLSKKEWKHLRNKYLNMQKTMMKSLKQQMWNSRWEKNKLTQQPEEKEARKEEKENSFLSGTVVKVTLDDPVTNLSNAKGEMRVHPEIKYVDVTEGSRFVYLRTATPELATTLVQTKHWPNMEVIQGDEETEYRNKIKIDREQRFKKNKNKPNQRGRDKLLKRAERFHNGDM